MKPHTDICDLATFSTSFSLTVKQNRALVTVAMATPWQKKKH